MANMSAHLSIPSQGRGETQADNMPVATSAYDRATGYPNEQIKLYLFERVPEFRALTEAREKGWKNPAGDEYFAKQRHQADNSNDKQALYFFEMMKTVGREIHRVTGVFNTKTLDGGPPRILDMCMAPGAFLHLAMEHNPEAHAQAFSLPLGKGGHKVFIQPHRHITINFADITMLGADMGLDAIPQEHPEAQDFLPRSLSLEDTYDLVICDGQVLRTHHRAAYRENREAARLTFTQLAIALEHVKPGGTMLVLLHKVESWRCVLILRAFCGFSSVRLFKQRSAHAKRSSCYMVASNIQSRHEDAVRAVGTWKMLWKAATFDTEEEFCRLSLSLEPDVKEVIDDFGPRLVQLGRKVWETQANALEKSPFVRGSGTWRRASDRSQGS
ncbi:hypothetical protein F4782DRAFT_499979 [Xylaria castorea]|nr:hypothetical protein F4782DRAFT_499979 [Xylaria castorea]